MDQNPRLIGNNRHPPSSMRPVSNGYVFTPYGDPGYMDSCSISSNDTESRTVDSGVSLSTQNSQQRTLFSGYVGGPGSPSQPVKSELCQPQHISHQQYQNVHNQYSSHHRHHQPPPNHHHHQHSNQQQPIFLHQQNQASRLGQMHGIQTSVHSQSPVLPAVNGMNSSGPQRLCHNPLYDEQRVMENIAAAAAAEAASMGNSCSTSNGKMNPVPGPKHSRSGAPPPPPPYTAYHNVLYVNTPPSVACPSNSSTSSVIGNQKHSVETQTDEPAQQQIQTNAAATLSALKLLRMTGNGITSSDRGVGSNSSTSESISRRSTLTREGDPEMATTKEMTDSVLLELTSLSRQLNRGLTLSSCASNSSGNHSSGGGASDVMSTDSMPVQRPLPRVCAGVCKVCHQKIVSVEDACSAMGNIYHNNCFTCCCCGKTLRGKIFYNDHGKIYCEEDYMYCGFQHTAEKCEACGHIITDMILNALGKSFHPGCFRCSVCKKCLDGVPFTVDMANKVYCIQDYHRVYAPKCASCASPIIPIEGSDEVVRVVAMDKDFHIDCYKCEDCKLQLTDEQDRRCYPLTGVDGSLHLLCHGCHLSRYARLTPSSTRSPLPSRSASCASSKHPYLVSDPSPTSDYLQQHHQHPHHNQSASQSKYQPSSHRQ